MVFSELPACAFKNVEMVHSKSSAKMLAPPVFTSTLFLGVPAFASRAAFLAALFFSRQCHFSPKAAREAQIWLGLLMSQFSSIYFLASR